MRLTNFHQTINIYIKTLSAAFFFFQFHDPFFKKKTRKQKLNTIYTQDCGIDIFYLLIFKGGYG